MPWLNDKSRMSGDVQVRFRESPRGRFPRATRLIITGRTRELLENEVKPLIEQFLIKRGLQLSDEKTRVIHIEEGFDFLGWNFRKYDGQMLTKPSKKNVQNFLINLREAVKKTRRQKRKI
jgi:RNA-directed DNA polymerase